MKKIVVMVQTSRGPIAHEMTRGQQASTSRPIPWTPGPRTRLGRIWRALV